MPKKYLDADFVLEKFREKMIEVEYDESYPPALVIPEGQVERLIDKMPTADVQEIVRCKDCEYHGSCSVEFEGRFGLDSFCCLGKRKDCK